MQKKVHITTDTTGDFFILLCMSAFVVVLMAKALTYAMVMRDLYSNQNQASPVIESMINEDSPPVVAPAQQGVRAI